MSKERNFNNQPMQHLRHYHPELVTPSGAIDGTKAPTGQQVARQTTNILVRAGILLGVVASDNNEGNQSL